MTDAKHILVAIDDFKGSEALIDYVSGLAAGGDHFQIHLFHAAGPLPPDLLESRGAEVPEREITVEYEQERAQDHWTKKIKADTERLFDAQKSRLAGAKIPAQNVFTHFVLLVQRDELIDEMIRAADQNHCGTIVVGHESYGWIRDRFQTHVSERLISEASVTAVCVVHP